MNVWQPEMDIVSTSYITFICEATFGALRISSKNQFLFTYL